MQTELYRKEGKLSSSYNLELETVVRDGLLNELGFRQVAKIKTANSKLENASVLYSELQGKELKLWKRFLPTETNAYNYNFDLPPTEALQAIKDAKDLMLFDGIQIWTPEGNGFWGTMTRKVHVGEEKLNSLIKRIDPMAVGVISDTKGNTHYFPIVRWGESLLPVNRIRTKVNQTRLQLFSFLGVLPVLLVLFGVAAYCKAINRYGFGSTICTTILSVMCAFIVGLLAAMVVSIIHDF